MKRIMKVPKGRSRHSYMAMAREFNNPSLSTRRISLGVFAPQPPTQNQAGCSHSIIVTSRTFGMTDNCLLRCLRRSHPCRYESYLQHSDPVVLALNPFFVLECVHTLFFNFLHSPPPRNDPTPSRSAQLPRAASLVLSSLGFIHDLRTGLLRPDTVRGTPLDMDQYRQLFGTARIPTERGCKMETASDSTHIIVLRRGQFCAGLPFTYTCHHC